MTFLLLGLAVLVVGLLLARGFTRANPTVMARQLRFMGGVLMLAFAAILVLRGQSGLGLMLGFVGWGLLMGRGVLPWGSGGWGGGAPSPGQASRIVTDHLDMEMDHETGAIRGQVRKGRYAGREIDMLAPAELADLWQDYSFADPTSAQVIEAYLDRRHPTWRDDLSRATGQEGSTSGANGGRGAAPGGGRMSRAEALEILGLDEDADADAVRTAHRDLMKRNHPDRGGSTYLAAKINEAKAVLIGD